jgi:hypothetical protein
MGGLFRASGRTRHRRALKLCRPGSAREGYPGESACSRAGPPSLLLKSILQRSAVLLVGIGALAPSLCKLAPSKPLMLTAGPVSHFLAFGSESD